MKKILTTFGIICLLIIGVQLISNAQVNQSSSKSELVQALENRTENERKLSTNLFLNVFLYQEKLTKGMSVQKAIESFDPEFYFVDNQNRILVMIRFNDSSFQGSENIRNILKDLGGKIKSDGIGHNNLYEIYWLATGRKDFEVSNYSGNRIY